MKPHIFPLAVRLWRRYTRHDVSHQAAALAYFLLFSLFPLLILAGSFLREMDLAGLLADLSHVLPERFLALVESYLGYAAEHSGRSLRYFSLVFSVWFPMRATDCLMHAVRRAYGLSEPSHPIRFRLKVLLYTVLLIFSIALTGLLVALSRDTVAAFAGIWGFPELFAMLWSILRFPVLGMVVFAALSVLYATAQDVRLPPRSILPGATISALAWIALSAVYSFYTEYISNYDLVYGALSTVAVVLIWLYLSAVVVIMGAEWNAVFAEVPERDARSQEGEKP